MAEQPRDTLHLNVEYFTGQEEDDDVGHPYYVASCDEIVAITDGDTWGDLMRNVATMVAAFLEDQDTVSLYNLVQHPRIVVTMELHENYAQMR